MAGKPEIGAKLTLDDHASKVLDKVKGGFSKLGETADSTAHHFIDFAKQTAAFALGFQLNNAVESMKELGRQALDRAVEADNQKKALAGTLAMTERAGTSWEVLSAKANTYQATLKGISAQTGITSATMSESFATIAEKMSPARATITATGQSILLPFTKVESQLQRTTAQITQTMADIGKAGRVMPGGADELAKAFSNFSGSAASARDPIVQMIAATGTLKGNAHQVAEQLHMLTDASALSFAEEAIRRMGKEAAKAPPDFNSTVNKLKELRGQFIEQFGAPILKAVVPAMDKFASMVAQNRTAIDHFTKVMGEKVGVYVVQAAKKLEEGFRWVLTHTDDIAKAIDMAVTKVQKVFTWILEHKEEIAIAFGAKALGGTAVGAAKGAVGLASNLAGAGDVHLPSMAGKGAALGASAAAAASTAVALAALAAVIFAVGAVAHEASGYLAETKGYLDPRKGAASENYTAVETQMKESAKAMTTIGTTEWSKWQKNYVAAAAAMGLSATAAEGVGRAYQMQHQQMVKSKDAADEAAAAIAANQQSLVVGANVPTPAQDEQNAGVGKIVEFYNNAVKTHNTAAVAYAAGLIEKSSAIQTALINSKLEIEGGFDGLTAALGEKGTALGEKLKGLASEAKGGAPPPKPTVQFNGGQTFNLKQDFRDQDPDRVAIVFQRDIIRAAEHRRMDRTGGVGGL